MNTNLTNEEQELLDVYRFSTGDEASDPEAVLDLLERKGIRTLQDLERTINEAEVNSDPGILSDEMFLTEGEDVGTTKGSKKKNKKKKKDKSKPEPVSSQGWVKPKNTGTSQGTGSTTKGKGTGTGYQSWGGRIMIFPLPRPEADLTLYAGPVSNAERMNNLDLMIDMSGSYKPSVQSTIPELASTHHLVKIDWPDGGVPKLQRDFWQRLAAYIEGHAPITVGLSCIGGRGRTGTALAILGVMLGLNDDTDPVDWVREEYYNRAVETPEQGDYIEKMTGLKVASGHHYEWGGYSTYNGYGGSYGGSYHYQGSQGSGYVGSGGLNGGKSTAQTGQKQQQAHDQVLKSRQAQFTYVDRIDKNRRFGIDVAENEVFVVDRRIWDDIAKIKYDEVDRVYGTKEGESADIAIQLAEEVVVYLLDDPDREISDAVTIFDKSLFDDPERVAADEEDRQPIGYVAPAKG